MGIDVGKQTLRALAVVLTREDVSHLSSEVADKVLSYVPDVPADEWEQVLPLVREIVANFDFPNVSYVPTTVRAVTRLGQFCVSHGVAPDIRTALTPSTVEWFAAVSRNNLPETGKGLAVLENDVSRLRVLGRTLRSELPWPSRAEEGSGRNVQPAYDDAEVATVLRLSQQLQNVRDRRTVLVVLGLGIGAGLNAGEMHRLEYADVYRDESNVLWVSVRSTTGETTVRSVPVASDWANVLEQALALPVPRYANGRVLSPAQRNGIGEALDRIQERNTGLDLNLHRMRTTWISHRMRSHVRLDVLMRMAGLSSAYTLVQIARDLPDEDPAEVISALTQQVPEAP